jgi:hypothetical protein
MGEALFAVTIIECLYNHGFFAGMSSRKDDHYLAGFCSTIRQSKKTSEILMVEKSMKSAYLLMIAMVLIGTIATTTETWRTG